MPHAQSSKSVAHRPEVAEWRDAIRTKLIYALGKTERNATGHDWFLAAALAVRDRIVNRWIFPPAQETASGRKRVYYLSIEYLIGRLLLDALSNLAVIEPVQEALRELGVDLEQIRDVEVDPGLGNGGLGRLAACFMDSMAALGIPAIGYGIRYRYGLFRQQITDGVQEELPDDWLAAGNPWEFERNEIAYPVCFGGMVEYVGNETARGIWYPAETISAVAYETPIVGWRGRHVNALRLWSARADDPVGPTAHRQAHYDEVMTATAQADAICATLYPSDATPAGQELRLRQEYFFTSASLQDILHQHLQVYDDLSSLPSAVAIQLNDTHPAIAVAELMRLLIDEHEFSWADAWDITTRTLNYTNHTLLPEALERWPVALLSRLLPRHLQIIYLINWLHLKELGDRGIDPALAPDASLIDEANGKSVRMGHLAFVGAHRVNGVSGLHTQLVGETIFHALDAVRPGRIVNETNGISFRRWLFQANPALTDLLTETAGRRLLDDPEMLRRIEPYANDAAFVERLALIRLRNKERLARHVRAVTGITIDPHAVFDVHIKRIHEYKRQLLNVLETIALYQAICADPRADWVPRVKIFAGKAAADYVRAKEVIRLVHDVGRVINADPVVAGRLKVVFLPNYSVSCAEQIVPAADISEQISTAGMEASGTGNMKLALNGALTIGTLDGANVEIREQVGADNIFIFGLTAAEVAERQRARLCGRTAVEASPILTRVVGALAVGAFAGDAAGTNDLIDALLDEDRFMVAADFDAYWQTQRALDALWRRPAEWWHKSILNTARMGWFSSDRTIRGYAAEIWQTAVPETP